MTQRYGLSEDQVTKVTTILQEETKKSEQVFNDTTLEGRLNAHSSRALTLSPRAGDKGGAPIGFNTHCGNGGPPVGTRALPPARTLFRFRRYMGISWPLSSDPGNAVSRVTLLS